MFVHKTGEMYHVQTKSPDRSTVQARDSGGTVIPPRRRTDVSMDLSPIRFSREPVNDTTSPTNSAEIRFPTMENDRANVGDSRPFDNSEGYGGPSFDARDREPTKGISRVEDLDYDEDLEYRRVGMSLEKAKLGRSSVQTTAESAASASTRALIKELQRHDE